MQQNDKLSMRAESVDINTNNRSPQEISKKILGSNQYLIIDDFFNKQSNYNYVKNTLFEGIKAIQGSVCHSLVKKYGLANMHKYFPADKLMLLEKHFARNAKYEIIQWAYRLWKNNLNFKDEFFVNDIVVLRIHFPFPVAIKSSLSFKEYITHMYPKSVKSELLTTNQKKVSKASYPKNQFEYHSKYPRAAYAHGPHIDSWLGAAYGVNCWWSIAGTTEDNCLVVYPETFDYELEHIDNVPYLAPGIALSKPHKVAPTDGSVLIFNGELLHGTQLNISNKTRVVVSIRVSPHKLMYRPDSVISKCNTSWYFSKDIYRGKSGNFKFKAWRDYSVVSYGQKLPVTTKSPKSLTFKTKLSENRPLTLCPSGFIDMNERATFNFEDECIIVIRDKNDIYAFSSLCPHLGVNLVDGFYENSHIYCPGHGVEFNLKSGSSKCDLLRLKTYEIIEHNNLIMLK